MKNFKGLLLIFLTIIITLVLWITAVPLYPLSTLDMIRHIIAGLALSGFFLQFVLASRMKFIEGWFNGLDKVYVAHKYVAIVSVALVVVHAILSGILEVVDSIRLTKVVGWVALVLFVGLTVITLFDKYIKLAKMPKLDQYVKYENWRLTHRLMLLAYAFGLFHMYISNQYGLLRPSALSIWQAATALIGLACGIYVVFFYQRTQFNHKGKVTKLTKLTPSILEWEITLNKPIPYMKGQFVFVKVFQKGIEEAPHPFSISGGDGSKIYLTTRNLGDFTKSVYDTLAVGTPVALNGPYGRMDFAGGRKDQVWIAGGIGITPFMAYLRDNTFTQNVEMFYSFNGAPGGVYKDYLEQYQKDHSNFKLHIFDTTLVKPLNLADYQVNQKASIFMCGPEPMVTAYVKYFKANYKETQLSFEAFKLH